MHFTPPLTFSITSIFLSLSPVLFLLLRSLIINNIISQHQIHAINRISMKSVYHNKNPSQINPMAMDVVAVVVVDPTMLVVHCPRKMMNCRVMMWQHQRCFSVAAACRRCCFYAGCYCCCCS